MRLLSYGILVVGGLTCALALPVLLFSVLAFCGIAADVSLRENWEIGFGCLKWGLPPMALGVVLLLTGLIFNARRKRYQLSSIERAR